MDGPQSLSGRFQQKEKKKFSPLPAIGRRFVDQPDSSDSLYQLRFPGCRSSL